MASDLKKTFGAKLERRNPSNGVYEEILQCTLIPVPGATQNYVPGTNHNSAGGFEETVPGLKTGDEASFTIEYSEDIALHTQLYDDYIAQTKLTWRTTLAAGTHGWVFQGYVSKFSMSLPVEGIQEAQMGIKVTGLPTRF